MDLVSLRALPDAQALALLACSVLGAGWLVSYALSFTRMLIDLARPGIPLRTFGARKGAWAGTLLAF